MAGNDISVYLPITPIIDKEDEMLRWAKAMTVAAGEGPEELAKVINEISRRIAVLENSH